MPDEGTMAPEELQDKPQEGSEQVEESTEPDYRSQYEELRTKFNERDSEISEARQMRELAQELGLTPAEFATAYRQALQAEDEPEPDDDDYEDPGTKAMQRVEQLEAQLEARQEEEQLQEAFSEAVEKLETDEGFELPAPFVRHIWNEGVNAGRMPDQVFKEDWPQYAEAASTWKAKQSETKRKAARPPAGSPGSPDEDLNTDDKRRDALARYIEEAQASLD